MREIKFRAWNGEEMISPDYIDRNGIAHWKENSIPTSSKIIMQFTGLQDKNGKDIYEGDILKMQYQEHSVAAIEFIEHGFFIKGRFNYIPSQENCKVIGNIHENKELLNGGDDENN